MRRRLLLALLVSAAWAPRALAAVTAPVAGEVQRITILNPSDHWSGGTIVVGGTIVTIPRNLLLDLPANRLTLQQLYEQAPAGCVAAGETGLAKTDSCNTSGTGAMATISANYTANGNVIAGDVLIEKGVESIIGQITYINYAQGYFRLNGLPNDPATGVMVRLNDPGSRHTVQVGAGCAGGPNCSADPRFTLDPDNYTNTFSSGYPWCIPSTVSRSFPALTVAPAIPAGATAAAADGSGDVLCPQTNRPGAGPVADSRHFAPVRLRDSINAEGNFETVNGVRFLSAHSTMVLSALTTSGAPGQPDYLFVEEAFIDGPGFQNDRARSLFIGFTTFAPADVLLWSIHYDPTTNSKHELPLGSTSGCDASAGAATCSGQGLAVNGADIFRIRHDVDFLAGAKARLNPCAHLAADPRMGAGICPAGGAAEDASPAHLAEQFAILSPIPHEVQFRTGRKVASLQLGATPLVTLDVNGNETPNGQYLFPFGMNLGGVDVPNAFEFNLNAVNTPFSFSGIPWNLDRRLSPGGCIDTTGDGLPDCEASPQPLDPFPFEGITMDPRTQATVPVSSYADPNFTTAPLTDSRNRVLSFVNAATGKFGGNATVLAWPPLDAPLQSIFPTPDLNLVCSAAGPPANTPPVAVADSATTLAGTPVVIDVLANDTDANGNPLTVSAVTQGANGAVANNGTSVTFTPNPGFAGADAFTVTISDGQGGTATAAVSVTVTATANTPPVANPDVATTNFQTAVVLAVLANDVDANGDPLTVTGVAPGVGGTVSTNGTTVAFTPSVGFSGSGSFTYAISDGRGGTAVGLGTVTVKPRESLSVTLALFRAPTEWRVSGTSTVEGATVTIHSGSTLAGPVIGAATVTLGVWTFRDRISSIASNTRVSVASTGGATLLNQLVTVR